jgi:hypothetical protein
VDRDPSGSGQEPVAGCCELGKEPFGSVEGGCFSRWVSQLGQPSLSTFLTWLQDPVEAQWCSSSTDSKWIANLYTGNVGQEGWRLWEPNLGTLTVPIHWHVDNTCEKHSLQAISVTN